MSKSKRGPASVPARTTNAQGLPSDVALVANLSVVVIRTGDEDETHDHASMSVALQADGDEELVERVDAATQRGVLKPEIRAFVQALVKAMEGERLRSVPTPSRQVGRA